MCSEPAILRQLSGQSSVEQYTLEESPEAEERENTLTTITTKSERKVRPGTLNISDSSNSNKKSISPNIMAVKKQLLRSNSSTLHYRPKPKPMTEYEQFYFTSTNGKSNNAEEFLQIINERRNILKSESISENSENSVLSSGTNKNTESSLLQKSDESINKKNINSESISEKSTNDTVMSSKTIALIHERPIENSDIVKKNSCHITDDKMEEGQGVCDSFITADSDI